MWHLCLLYCTEYTNIETGARKWCNHWVFIYADSRWDCTVEDIYSHPGGFYFSKRVIVYAICYYFLTQHFCKEILNLAVTLLDSM